MSNLTIDKNIYVGDTGYKLEQIKNNAARIGTLENDTGYKEMISFGSNFEQYINSDYRDVRVRRIGKVCYLTGLINVKQEINNSTATICTLPEGFRPNKRIYLTVACSSGEVYVGGHPCLIAINPNGQINLHNSYCTGWISLDGVTYIQD